MPLVSLHVSGLWQYRQRHMQPVVHATTRTPGPSTVEPVVKEWRNPMSPEASASRTVCSGRYSASLTRSSKGLFAASETVEVSGTRVSAVAVERAIDDVHLLLATQPHEVHRVPRDPDRQARVLLRVLHGVEQGVAIQDVDVHVVAGGAEERIEDRGEVRDPILGD